MLIFFFKQKTAYEMRRSDWSSDVCSSDLVADRRGTSRSRRMTGGGVGYVGTPGPKPARGDAMTHARAMLDTHPSPPGTLPTDALAAVLHPLEECAQIGRASCRESVCKYVSISVVAVSLKKKEQTYI